MKAVLTNADGSTVLCACKTLKDGADRNSRESLLAEAGLATTLAHANVVTCFGQVTLAPPSMIVFEFLGNGSLEDHLRSALEAPGLEKQMRMAIDIGAGMRHLELHNHVHRDLAARNVLVANNGTCKIGDFGLSRAITENEDYYNSKGGMIAVRWTPPEAYTYNKYSSASDVWSYGITIYEIWTKGARPYGNKWTNLYVMINVERGYRLPAPPGCPKAVYCLMMECWNPLRRQRPTFKSIVAALEMAHAMLFPADESTGGQANGTPALSLAQDEPDAIDKRYVGIEVPSEENVDDGPADGSVASTGIMLMPDGTSYQLSTAGLLPALSDPASEMSATNANANQSGLPTVYEGIACDEERGESLVAAENPLASYAPPEVVEVGTRRRADSASIRERLIGEVQVHGLNAASAEQVLKIARDSGPGGHLFYRSSATTSDSIAAVLAIRSGAGDTLGIHHVEVDRSTSDDGTQLYSLRPLPENKFRSLEDLRQHYKRAREPRLPNRLTATVDPAGSESAV